MQPSSLQQRLLRTILPVLLVGGAVVVFAGGFAGVSGAIVAVLALLTGCLIASTAELGVAAFGISRPLDRLLFTMLLRSVFSVIAIGAAIAVAKLNPTLVVLIAAPLYLALLVGEAISAIQADKAAAQAAPQAIDGRV